MFALNNTLLSSRLEIDKSFSSVAEFNTGFMVYASGHYIPMTETMVEKNMIAFHGGLFLFYVALEGYLC